MVSDICNGFIGLKQIGYLPQSALLYALYSEVVAWKEMKEISYVGEVLVFHVTCASNLVETGFIFTVYICFKIVNLNLHCSICLCCTVFFSNRCWQ